VKEKMLVILFLEEKKRKNGEPTALDETEAVEL